MGEGDVHVAGGGGERGPSGIEGHVIWSVPDRTAQPAPNPAMMDMSLRKESKLMNRLFAHSTPEGESQVENDSCPSIKQTPWHVQRTRAMRPLSSNIRSSWSTMVRAGR